MVHFLSRDAANEEKKELEREIGRSRDIIKQKDAQLSEKDQRIREVLQESESRHVLAKQFSYPVATAIVRANA